jgi:protein TonB
MLRRYTVSFGPAAVVTLGLLLLMQALIATGRPAATNAMVHRLVEFVRVIRDSPPIIERQQPDRLPEPATPPERVVVTSGGDGPLVTVVRPAEPDLRTGGTVGFALADGEALALFRVAPTYPAAAIRQNLEGYVIVAFTVQRSGAVADVTVVESSHRVFERAAVEAAAKFRYKPRVIGGEPTAVYDVRTRITFELEASAGR